MDNDSESKNGLRGVDVIVPSHEKEGPMAPRDRRTRPGTPGEAYSSGYSRSGWKRGLPVTSNYHILSNVLMESTYLS